MTDPIGREWQTVVMDNWANWMTRQWQWQWRNWRWPARPDPDEWPRPSQWPNGQLTSEPNYWWRTEIIGDSIEGRRTQWTMTRTDRPRKPRQLKKAQWPKPRERQTEGRRASQADRRDPANGWPEEARKEKESDPGRPSIGQKRTTSRTDPIGSGQWEVTVTIETQWQPRQWPSDWPRPMNTDGRTTQ